MKIDKQKLFEIYADVTKNSKILKQRTEESLNWFKTIIQSLSIISKNNHINPLKFFDAKSYSKLPLPGNIVTFNYSPIHADTLPYYDNFPLVLILKFKKNYFLGINFHYLPHKYRLVLMSRLYKYIKLMNNQKIIINIDYKKIIKSYELRYFRPCLKMYKISRIKKMSYTVTPDEWDMALFMPFEKFSKSSTRKIWEDSMEIIKKYEKK